MNPGVGPEGSTQQPLQKPEAKALRRPSPEQGSAPRSQDLGALSRLVNSRVDELQTASHAEGAEEAEANGEQQRQDTTRHDTTRPSHAEDAETRSRVVSCAPSRHLSRRFRSSY